MSPLITIVLVVLVDLMGFTIVMPLLAPFAKQYGFSPMQIGALMAAYPLCQLIAGPILGRLSDRYGRRPVLVFSQAGTALSFLIMGLTRDYTTLLLARMLDGASGGNILVAQAYVADVTPPEQRSRGLGMIGAAFGIGFVLGPLLSGLILDLPVSPDLHLRLPFLVAAGFSTIALLLVVFRLPESRPAGAVGQSARTLSLRGLTTMLSSPGIRGLVGIGTLTILAWSTLEATYSLFLRERLGWNASQAAYAFAFLGAVVALVQGGLIRRLVPKYGEPKLIIWGIALATLGLAGLAMSGGLIGLLLATLVVGVGQGIAAPTIQGLLSRSTSPEDQGAILGAYGSAQMAARMVCYMVANVLLGAYGPAMPFWQGAVTALAALGLAIAVVGPGRKVRDQVQEPAEAVA
ncbi:MFS transporter [Isosphaeraceae bacterium EP7]